MEGGAGNNLWNRVMSRWGSSKVESFLGSNKLCSALSGFSLFVMSSTLIFGIRSNHMASCLPR